MKVEMVLKKQFGYLSYLKALCVFCLLLIITSCGDNECYYDVVIGEEGSYIQKTKNINIDVKDTTTDAGISIKNGKQAILTVNGIVSMCNNTQNQGINYATTCNAGVKTICQNICTDSDSECVDFYASSCTGTTITSSELCSSQEVSVCINGTKSVFVQEEYVEDTNGCSEPITCSDDGTEQYTYYDSSGTQQIVPIGTCTTTQSLTSYTAGVDSTNDQWVEVGSDIYKGDFVTFSITAPTDGVPYALYKNVEEQPNYSSPGNTALNRFAPSSSWYNDRCPSEGCDTSCPTTLSYNTSLSDLAQTYPNCSAISQLISDGFTVQSYDDDQKSLWNTFGKSLVLQGIEDGDCPTDSTQCDGTYFNSSNTDISSDFGALAQTTDEKGDAQNFTRNFISQQAFSKVCSKICDTHYEDNLGGYTLNITRKSCVAVNGNPSPCCDDGRGALEYRFGEDGDWVAVSSTAKYAPSMSSTSSDSFTITNDNTDTQELYFRVQSTDSIRPYALGTYSINISYQDYTITVSDSISNIIENIKDSMQTMIFGDPSDSSNPGMVQQYFTNLAGDVPYIQYIRLLLVLSIIIYGLAFLTGYTGISQTDLILWVLKMGVVLTFISDQSYSFFHDNLFQLFIEGSDDLIQRANFVDSNPGTNTFSFVDDILILLFFNKATWLKILSLLASSPIGIILVILFLVGLLYFLVGVLVAVISYLMCILAVAVLIFLAPIFIPFILFEPTNYLFKNWCKLLARYALEPVLLIIGLQVLVALFYAVFVQVMNFSVCWKCMWPINFGAVSSIDSFLKSINVTTEVFCISFFGPFGFYGTGGLLFSGLGILLPNIILLVIIANLIKNYNGFISIMLDNVVGGRPAMLRGGGGVAGEAGTFVRRKLGVGKLEKWTGKQVRRGIKATTGLDIKTRGERDEAKGERDEAAKRKGLRSLGIDLDRNKFHDIVDRLSVDEYAKTLHKDDKINTKAAEHLGGNMFAALSSNKTAYADFVNGMGSIRDMKTAEAAKLDKQAPGIKDLHKVLNTPAVGGSFNDLLSKNKAMRGEAMNRVGKLMFMDKAVAKTLLDKKQSRALSKTIFKLGRTPRSGIK